MNEINNQNMLQVGTILHGTYKIESYLASGGFGNTYLARNIEFDETYAIKEFFVKGVCQRDGNSTTISVSNAENTNSFEQQREKFKKEARRLRSLSNPHIVKVYDLFEENGTAYYVMDYVDGENLSARLKRTNAPLAESEVRNYLNQILDGLEAIHNEGMFHLDIKPANIMVDSHDVVKLIDFGASKQQSTVGGATMSTGISYTNGYAPSEQMAQSYDKFGPWTDFYALGATVYKLLTNQDPPSVSDLSEDETEDKHLALPMPNVSEEMKKLVVWMMQVNRLKRPKNVGEIRKTLQDYTVCEEDIVLKQSVFTTSNDEETICAPSGGIAIDNCQEEVSLGSEEEVFEHWMIRNSFRPFSFRGRIGRLQYLLSVFGGMVVYFLIFVVGEKLFVGEGNNGVMAIWMLVATIVLYWFIFAQSCKRCHDLGCSGIWQFVPIWNFCLYWKAGNQETNNYGSGYTKTDNTKTIVIFGIIVFVLLGIIGYSLVVNTKSTGGVKDVESNATSDSEYAADTLAIINIANESMEIAGASCIYSGEAIEKSESNEKIRQRYIPNGEGKATFDDGRYYQGSFVYGSMDGDNAYFVYPNGDTYEGSFKDNHFSKGTYTVKATGEQFTGTFDSYGQPKKGSWYDKNGNFLQSV